MAILRVPRITTAQRLPLVLLDGEVVYDTDKLKFYGGDGVTAGGKPIGAGVPEGGLEGDLLAKASSVDFDTEWIPQGSLIQGFITDVFTLDLAAISAKKLKLSQLPKSAEGVRFSPDGGPDQRLGVDFILSGDEIIWDGLTLDGFLEIGETIRVSYPA